MILDTNALSALLEGNAQLLVCLQNVPVIQIPVIVLGEYRYGVLRSRLRRQLETHLNAIEKTVQVLSVDGDTARFYAQIRSQLRQAGRPIPENDIWIAALARQHNLPIVSRDTHFDAVANVKRIFW